MNLTSHFVPNTIYHVKTPSGLWKDCKLVSIIPGSGGRHTHYCFYNSWTGRNFIVRSSKKIQVIQQVWEQPDWRKFV